MGYRIASLDAKSSSKGFLDLSMDGEEDIDESLLANVTKSFDDLRNDRNRCDMDQFSRHILFVKYQW